ncbi:MULTISPECIES: hypothetical protein [unclassified Bradyrhizobium]|uniref:hypothetical protein n=1 Tax=unclassified Bradyrhizobium TaxID=2631580 RepID=UPI002FF38238
MNRESMRLRITGTKRLIMHSGRLADPLDPITQDLARLTAKRPKTIADHKQISKVEWFGGLWLHNGAPCIPAEALAAAFVGGAKALKRGPQAAAGIAVEHDGVLSYDGPTDVDQLWETGRFVFRCAVKVGINAKTMRTRPCFNEWQADLTVNYFPSIIDGEHVIQALAMAGIRRGLGDWRPQNGTFEVKKLE